ncbi:T6SS effector BTH_I2691 family protein [Cupriavidus sp. 30B13]|uniref:T6SS effector BTH_I2691 family protein n=1 Tax=Cupriavidus sp. 30B13 TaxID=3384241 RepID=UPI003B90E149
MTTNSPATLLPQALRVAQKTRRDEAPGPCVECKTEVAILPLRYAVLAHGDLKALDKLAPQLSSNLGKNFPAFDKLNVRYAVRSLREGYLYAFVKRLGREWSCESAWHAVPAGVFHPVWPYAPHQPISETQGIQLRSGWTICFKAPEDVEELRLLFTPDPLTKRMVDDVRDNTALRDKLQQFDIREIAKTCSFAADVLDPSAIDGTLSDAIAGTDKALAPVLAGQLYSSPDYEYHAQWVASELKETDRRARGCAVVLHDPIGITQQLNAWRNEAAEQLKDYLGRKNRKGISNERMILVAQAFDDVRQLFEEKSAAIAAQHYIDIERAKLQDPGAAATRGWVLGKEQDARWKRAAEQHMKDYEATIRARVQTKLDSGEYRNRFETSYVNPPDPQAALQVQAMKANLANFEKQCKALEELAEGRSNDHHKWLQSEQLLSALDVYDNKDHANGWHFSGQTGLCVLGAEGCKATADIIQKWWEGSATDRANLAMRGFALNQKDMLAEMARMKEAAKAAPLPVTGADIYDYTGKSLERAKTLGDMFDKANGLYEEMEKAGNARLAGGAPAWYTSLGRQTLRRAPKGMEWFVHGFSRSLLAAGIGRQAVKLRLKELQAIGRSADPKFLRAQVKRNVNFAFATELVDARSSEFYKVRASGWLLLFEAALLSHKWLKGTQDEKEKTELSAAAITTFAASLEVLACGTEVVLRQYAAGSTTSVGAAVFLGGLKLWGAALATTVGIYLVRYDWSDANEARNHGNSWLSIAYLIRFSVTVSMIASQASIAFAAAGPMLKLSVERAVYSRSSTLFSALSRSAAFLGKETFALLMQRILFRGTGVVLVVSAFIAIFDDDALQKWCKRTMYRGPKFDREKPYKDTKEELAGLYGGLHEVF